LSPGGGGGEPAGHDDPHRGLVADPGPAARPGVERAVAGRKPEAGPGLIPVLGQDTVFLKSSGVLASNSTAPRRPSCERQLSVNVTAESSWRRSSLCPGDEI